MTTATTDLSRVFARQIKEGKLSLPTMPGTAAEVLALSQQESTDAAKLSAVLHKDQAIAGSVLRVANSAAYAGQVPCASLQQAVSRLGLQLITEIATAVSVRGRLFGNPKCAELLAALWKHSVLTGFYTKEIARLRRRNVEVAFLCGLLHDLGKAVLLDNVDRVLGKQDLAIPVHYLLAAVHEQHLAAGALLATEWRLPEQIAEAIACHHDFAAAKHFQDMAMTVCLADLLSHHIAPGPFAEPPTAEALAAHPVLEGLNLYPDQFQELLQKRERALLVTEGMR
ncbi:MAG: HDOD domain-containing protein [Planctomycetes bacterium]|nr:HDOD domain-containing protein [Planctomycetota bacterium]